MMEPTETRKEDTFSKEVVAKAGRKLRARQSDSQSVWSGLGMFGLVGWSVTVPTLLGAGAGIWLDAHHPQSFSWTLSLLIAGLLSGCLIAWHWIDKEHKEMNEPND